jgi:small ubiquitin-related modifier
LEDAQELNQHLVLHGDSKMSEIDTLGARIAELERQVEEEGNRTQVAEQARVVADTEKAEAEQRAQEAEQARVVAEDARLEKEQEGREVLAYFAEQNESRPITNLGGVADDTPNTQILTAVWGVTTQALRIGGTYVNEMHRFRMRRTDKLGSFFDACALIRGEQSSALRFFMNFERLNGNETPNKLDMEDGDRIDVLTELFGMISDFNTHADSPGIALLADEGQSSGTTDRAQVRTLVHQLNGVPGASFRSSPGVEILDAATRGLLMRHLDGLTVAGNGGANTHGAAAGSDLKMFLSLDELTGLVGGDTMTALQALFSRGEGGNDPSLACNCVALRRAEATMLPAPHCINFHRDVQSARTLQVPLNGDDEYEGGRLVFATDDGRLQYPTRPAGSVTVHGGGVVHGVTALRCGVRYGLFLLHEVTEMV